MSTATQTKLSIEFDEATHSYRVDGREVLSVTQVFDICGLVPSWCKSPATAERGAFVHLTTELFDRGELNLEGLDPRLTPYLQAWEAFRGETRFEPLLIEKRVADPVRGYAGTFDRQGILNGKEVLLDIKSGAVGDTAAMQLAAYGNAYWTGKLWNRAAVQLNEDGRYAVYNFGPESFRSDIEDFFACLRVAQFKRRTGQWQPQS